MGGVPVVLHVVGGHGAVHGGAAIFGPEVEDGAAIDKRHHHPTWLGSDPGDKREGSLCNCFCLILLHRNNLP